MGKNRLINLFLPVFLLLLLLTSLIYESIHDSPTYDEPANMAASFAYVYKNDYRLYPDNPPFVKILAGLMLLPIANKINFPDQLPVYNDPAQFDLYKFGTEFLYRSANPTEEIIFLTRLPNIIITILLGILIYYVAGKLYGPKASLLALFLYCLDPNIRGHGHILAFDIPLAFISLLAFYFLLQFINSPKKRSLYSVFLILTFTAGYLTKFTFVFAALIYISIIGIYIYQLAFNKFHLLSLLIIPFLLLWFFALLTNYNRPTLNYSKLPIIESAGLAYKNNLSWNIISHLPVPYYYRAGMLTMYSHNNLVGQPPAFLLGTVHAVNDWLFYFPVSFIFKTPIPTLILIIISSYLLSRLFLRRKSDKDTSGVAASDADSPDGGGICRRIGFISILPFLFAFYFMFSLMLFSHINNVYRYLFPSLIFFVLGTSQIVNFVDFNKISIKLFIILNSLFMILTSFFSFPLDLSYTNELTGIPPQGHKYLSDSEVDWGQDLKRLGEWVKKCQMSNVKCQNLMSNEKIITLSYLGTADPEYYGIKYKPLQFEDLNKLSGTVIISVGNLTLGDWQWTSKPEYKAELIRAPLDFLRTKKPEAVIGKSIFVYRF